MIAGNDFNTEQDEALGRLLREHLEGSDVPRFLARVQQTVTTAERETAWDTLGRWAVPGLVAASIAAATLAWIGLGRDQGVVDPSPVSVQVMVAGEATVGDLLIAAIAEGR